MHGGSFRVIGMGQHPNAIPMTKSLAEKMYLTRSLITKPMAHKSPIKDTISIPSRGYALVRFIANNPGKSCELFLYFNSYIHIFI